MLENRTWTRKWEKLLETLITSHAVPRGPMMLKFRTFITLFVLGRLFKQMVWSLITFMLYQEDP